MPPAIIGGALGLAGALFSSQASKKAARTGAEASSQASQDQLQLMREQLAATQPLRDLALEQGQLSLGNQQELFPLLQQAINQPLQLGQGVSQIQSSLAPFGLEDSSVSGTAVGQFAESARQNRLQNILSGLGLGGIPGGFGTAGLGTAAQLGQGAAQSQFGAGQFQAAGQLGAGQAFAQPLLQLGGFGLQGGFNDLFKGTGTPLTGTPTPLSTTSFGSNNPDLISFGGK